MLPVNSRHGNQDEVTSSSYCLPIKLTDSDLHSRKQIGEVVCHRTSARVLLLETGCLVALVNSQH